MRFALIVLTAVLLASAPAWAQDITGPARVIDGDTLDSRDSGNFLERVTACGTYSG